MNGIARRQKAERFRRIQHQFARARAHRELVEFRAALDDLVERAVSAAPATPPPPTATAPTPVPDDRAEHDQAMRDLLVRVNSRVAPPDNRDAHGWWSPEPVHGFRVWQLMEGAWHGARLPWPEPSQTAECLHRGTDPEYPVPHDVAVCRHPPCGIYSVKEPDRLGTESRLWFGGRHVTIGYGVVELTGRVIEHDRGYRAEHARVVGFGVLVGDSRWVTRYWFDDPQELRRLFADPQGILGEAPGEPSSTTHAIDRTVERLQQRALASA